MRAGSAVTSISTTLPSAMTKPKTARTFPPGAQTAPGEPSTSAGCAPRARPRKVSATARRRGSRARTEERRSPDSLPPPQPPRCRRATRRPDRAPPAAPESRRPARPRERRRPAPAGGPRRRPRPRARAGPDDARGWPAGGSPPSSAPRSARCHRTTGRTCRAARTPPARPAPASPAPRAGRRRPSRRAAARARVPGRASAPACATRLAPWRSTGSSRRDLRVRNMSRQTRATTVVSQPPRLSTAPLSDRLSRSQAS